jgi:chromosome segregation ATPase
LRRASAWDNHWAMSPSEYEQLVEILGRQFTDIDRRFDLIAGRFDQVDRRFDEVDGQIAELRREMLGHFDEIYRRLERLEQEYQAITQGLRRIEASLADESGRREILTHDLAELKQQVAALQSRIEEIEARLGR